MYKLLIVFLLVISCQETKIKDSSKKTPNPIDYYAYHSDNKPNIDSLFQVITLRPDDTLKANDLLTINWATQSELNNLGWNIYRGLTNDLAQTE